MSFLFIDIFAHCLSNEIQKKQKRRLNMKFGVNSLITILLICFGTLAPVHAEVEYNVLKTYKLEDQPVDMAFSTQRNEIYVLNSNGELLIYAANGRLTEKINVGRDYDRLQLVQGSDVLFLSSRKDKTIQIIQLEFIQKIDTSGSPYKGSENAPVVIAVFSEYQCPHCSRLTSLLDQVMEKYPKQVKMVYKNFPIRSHKYSELSAKAALAAQRQGKFWPFHDLLYAHYRELSNEKIREFAERLKLDMVRFEKDRKDPAIADKIRADIRDGRKANIRGVPSVFINGRPLRKRSLQGFSEIIDKELQKAGNPSPQK
jgi:protein-disulfide isomerase